MILVSLYLYKALAIRAMYLGWRADLGPSAIPALIGGLDDASEMTRAVTVSALARFGLEALAPLNDALQDSYPVTREGAAMALGRMAKMKPDTVPMLKKQSTPLLKVALNDESNPVQVHAAKALWNIEKDPAMVMGTFLRLLEDPNPNVRYYAYWGLREMGPLAKDAIPALMKARHSESDLYRVWADSAFVLVPKLPFGNAPWRNSCFATPVQPVLLLLRLKHYQPKAMMLPKLKYKGTRSRIQTRGLGKDFLGEITVAFSLIAGLGRFSLNIANKEFPCWRKDSIRHVSGCRRTESKDLNCCE